MVYVLNMLQIRSVGAAGYSNKMISQQAGTGKQACSANLIPETLTFSLVFFLTCENSKSSRLAVWQAFLLHAGVCVRLQVQTATWVVFFFSFLFFFGRWGKISPAWRGEIRKRGAGSYLMLEELKGEGLPLRRSFDSWLLDSAEWREATSAHWQEGHTLTVVKVGGPIKGIKRWLTNRTFLCW